MMPWKNMHNITFEDMRVSRRLRGLLHKLGIESAFSWDIETEGPNEIA